MIVHEDHTLGGKLVRPKGGKEAIKAVGTVNGVKSAAVFQAPCRSGGKIGDAAEDLAECANRLVSATTTNSFTVSFTVSDPAFPLPEGRCRMYLTGIPARDVEITGAKATFTDPQIRLVFIADSMDTRFDTYGVLRTIDLLDSEEETP